MAQERPRVGIITGLAAEAACLNSLPPDQRPVIACAGASAERAETAARRLIAQGCAGLVSFGTAGGLDPSLPSGAVVVADRVIDETGTLLTADSGWRARLLASLAGGPAIVEKALLGRDGMAMTASGKVALWRESGCVAIDMESHAVARVAAEAARPFLVVRVIADRAERTLPPWLARALGEDGQPRVAAVCRELLANPGDVPVLFGLARDWRRALTALRRVVIDAGPLFQFDA
jgi:adenosylhomocysteine nucleosidase